MKPKVILFICLLMGIGLTPLFAQTLQKGSVLGFHHATITLNPDVTINQFIGFIKDKYFAEVEKNFPGMKCYILMGVRGENVDCISLLYLFQSDEVRNKYWKKEGDYTELGELAREKMNPVIEEMAKYGEMDSEYTDWVIQ